MKVFPYPSMRGSFDLRFYFVVGPQDCGDRTLIDVVAKALDGGVSFLQLRAKDADAAEIVSMASDIAEEIRGHHLENDVAFVIDDRVDAALQARAQGIKVDGVHIGQTDIDPVFARQLLGDDAIIGLSCKTVKQASATNDLPANTIDYIGAGPLHMTSTKPDCVVVDEDGTRHTLDSEQINDICDACKVPVVVGGGVHQDDIPELALTKAAGWFVVSAIAAAEDPEKAATELVDAWRHARGNAKPEYPDYHLAPSTLPAVLTIATTDSSGGAGILADVKTMLTNDVFAECVVAGITAQNTTGVQEIAGVDPSTISAQIDSVYDDIPPKAVKIGVIVGTDSIRAVAERLRHYGAQNVVLDPVMVAASGSKLTVDDSVSAMVEELFPLATVITPNIPEAETLWGREIHDEKEMENCARELAKRYNCAVLVKGGHGVKDANDVLATSDGEINWYLGERIDNPNTHGTGCTLSSAIAAHLARGEKLEQAIGQAKVYLSGALRAMLNLGKGSGPMDHGWQLH